MRAGQSRWGAGLATVLAVAACTPAPQPRIDSHAGPVATLGSPTDLATGLSAPWGLTFLPDGSALRAVA